MASLRQLPKSPWRAVIESAFFANSVKKTDMAELYNHASKQPEVMMTDEPMYKPQQFGLPKNAKVLISNDGGIVGRTARARRLVREFSRTETDKYLGILGEAVYSFSRKPGFWLEGMIGLHPKFMIKAHLLSPQTDAKNMLDWGFNFAPFMEPWSKKYTGSRQLDEPDILVFADPEWSNPEFPNGLVIIDEIQNCIAILGLRYFGERKKGTLTIAWTAGVRQNMVACHGGIKTIGNKPPVAVFGLSGSGKSSITNSLDHDGTLHKNEKVVVIHDDAFLIDLDHNISIALEPALFDKTDSLDFRDSITKYFYSAQNVAVTLDKDSKRRIVGQDIRNDNGRCIKSRDMFTHNDFCKQPGMVIWLQKDTSLPPISKVATPALAVAMGASLSTLRAKGVENMDPKELGKLVIEPFANPFRVHPLVLDCHQFLKLFKAGCECFIMNTHAFGLPDNLTDIPKELSLNIVTQLVRGKIEWREWKRFSGLLVPKNGTEILCSDYDKKYKPLKTPEYLDFLRDRMQDRITFLSNKRDLENDMENAFIDPLVSARTVIDKILNPV
ncbi:MAG: phosphoenolpyruvate carboxykinase (ATP) [Dissulfurispiraceae bacterium]|jgi:phosphoenolpyruvate carboxykinase (ATP)|nr:phosphoenolpyruvate carboxykinase (ATP) [Dissulfurispiraceae bacterium]